MRSNSITHSFSALHQGGFRNQLRYVSGLKPYTLTLTLLGGLIVADMFINGSSIEESNERFEALAKHVFQRREILNIPFFPRFLHPLPSLFRILELLISYFADGLYPSQKIDEALKQVFGADRSILDISRAFASGTLVGLPVATTDDKPTCRIFTNYNGVGERINHLGMTKLVLSNEMV